MTIASLISARIYRALFPSVVLASCLAGPLHAQTLLDPSTAPGTFNVGGKLNVTGNGGALFSGAFNPTQAFVPGAAGARMFWNPNKAAFRAGYLVGTEWDDSNSGQYSFAAGYSAKASNSSAIALGNSVTSTGGAGSLATGNGTYATGSSSFATGSGNTASGTVSIVGGIYSSATGYGALAIGTNVQATNTGATALGASTVAGGSYATAIGTGTTANAMNSLVIGRSNVIEGTPGTWVDTEPLFVVGNGTGVTNDANRYRNAFTVYKNGDIKIKKVQGDISVGIFTAP